jgi:cytochrome P450
MAGDFWGVLAAHHKNTADELRAGGPVVEVDGAYHLTRREDVLAVLQNSEVYSAVRQRGAAILAGFDVVALDALPLTLDPPDHTRYRKMLAPLLAGAVRDLVPVLTGQAGALIDAVAASGGCDAMASVAHPFAAQAFMTLCGFPLDDSDRVARWVGTLLDPSTDDGCPYLSAVFEMFGYLTAAVGERRSNPGLAGVLSPLVAGLNDSEAVAMSMVLALGGLEIVATTACNALWVLAMDPQLRDVLLDDPKQVPVFVDEILRLEPTMEPARWCTRDVTIAGVQIPAGSAVRLHLGVINRDEGDGITVVDGRIVRRRHWSFGAGPHRCPGAHLARAELTVMITEWLRRIPEFSLDVSGIYKGGAVPLPRLPLRWSVAKPAVPRLETPAGVVE